MNEPVMRSGDQPVVSGAAVALALLVPHISFALFALRGVMRRPFGTTCPPRIGRWLRTWLVVLGPLLLVAATSWFGPAPRAGLLTALIWFVLGVALVRVPRGIVVVAGTTALAVLVVAAGLERVTAERTWYDPRVAPALDLDRVEALITGVQRVEVGAAEAARLERAWRLETVTRELDVTFEARSLDGPREVSLDVIPAVGAGHRPIASAALTVDTTWQRLNARLEPGELTGPFRTTLRIVGPAVVEVRGLRLTTPEDDAVRVHPRDARARLWYGGPNLLGHTLAMGGLMVAVAARAPAPALVALVMAGASIVLTGSRTAALVFVVSAVAIAAVRGWWSRTSWLLVGTVVALLSVALVLLGDDAGRLTAWSTQDPNVQSRVAEFRDAWQAMVADPMRGVGEGNLPSMAHNMWLQLGAEFGVPGLLAALWFAVGLLVVAARRGQAAGVVLASAYLALQLSDVSWFYPGVFLPLLVGLAVMDESAS